MTTMKSTHNALVRKTLVDKQDGLDSPGQMGRRTQRSGGGRKATRQAVKEAIAEVLLNPEPP